jgi:energy-coupling factor transporter ATP-binding protein EcfA2
MPEIRKLLSAAQQAEIRGDKPEAIRLLREAAAAYRDRAMAARALKLLRHIRRLQGLPPEKLDEEDPAPGAGPGPRLPPGDELGFGDSLLPEGGFASDELEDRDEGGESEPRSWSLSDDEDEEAPISRRRIGRTLVEQRGPRRADPTVDAWCSFCCRPKVEVGALVAGPAGAFICATCVRASAELLGNEPLPPSRSSAPAPDALVSPPRIELPAQAAARARLDRVKPRLALVVGPEGAGKSAFLRTLARPMEPPLERLEGDVVAIDLTAPLSAADEARLFRWLDEHPQRRAVLAARGAVPKPVLVLKGEHGDEPVFDTAALAGSVTHLSPAGLARVDAVLQLEPPDRAALESLAKALLEVRGVVLADEAVAKLVDLAEKAGRGAHELAALIARIPPGRYTS